MSAADPRPPRGPWAVALYRRLLVLLPRDFTARFSDDMLDLLERRIRDAPTRWQRWRIGCGAVVDLCVEAARWALGGRGRHARRRGGAGMDGLLHDARHTARSLARAPGFSAIVVLTIGVGIGATTAIFSVVNGVLLRPLPFTEPDRLAMIWNDNRRIDMRTDITSWPTFEDWRTGGQSFQSMAGFRRTASNLSGDYEPERVSGAAVSADFFDVFGVRPQVGRLFSAAEMEVGAAPVALISDGIWTRWFGRSTDVVGRRLRLDGEDVEILGVMPERFDFPDQADVWTPLRLPENARRARGNFFLWVVGRLADGASFEGAQAEMDAVAESLAEAYPQNNDGMGVYVQPMLEHLIGDVRPAFLALLGAVAFVLLIACANVTNLLLTRSISRHQETATRAALGAERGRLVRQSLTESLLLSLAGGAVGAAIAYGGVSLLKAVAPADFPRLDEIALDGGVLALALLLALLTGLLLGVAPALHATSGNLTAALGDEARGSLGSRTGWRTRGALVVAELALSLVLLVGAGLLIRSFVGLAGMDAQFDRGGVLTARLSLEGERYSDRASVVAFYDRLLDRLGSLPDVESVAAGSTVLLPQLPNSGSISVEGQPQEPDAVRIEVTTDAVTPGYFSTIGTPILLGRDFGPEDDAGSTPVTIVNEAMVRRYWPAEDPLGKRFKFGSPNGSAPWLTVVGVVADWRRTTPEREARPSSYRPHRQSGSTQMMVFARTAGDPLALAATLRAAARELDATQPVSDVITLEGLLTERLARRRLVTLMAGLFAAVAVLLTLVGVYGVLSYAVAQSTREIGLRMALGGDVRRVLAMIYRRLGRLLAAGLVIGTLGAVATTRVLRSLLYGVSALDPATFVLAPALLGAVALAACYLPARRATRVDPAVALRSDT